MRFCKGKVFGTKAGLVTAVLMAVTLLAGCGGGGSPAPVTQTSTTLTQPPVLAAILVKSTSYANAKEMGLEPVTLPKEAGTYDVYARADFKQNGTMMLFTAALTYDFNKPQSEATPGIFSFYSKAADGSWAKEANMLDTQVGCLHPRKAVVADFNRDGKPDIMVACHGYDAVPFPGESAFIVLSGANGRYVSKPIPNFSGFFHSATAADFNNDGYADILATDTNSPNKVRMLLGNGDGTFTEVMKNIVDVPSNQRYFTVEAVDVNLDGKIDLLLGADEHDGSRSVVVVGNGTSDFSTGRVVVLPLDAANATVLDFVVKSGKIYLNRTDSNRDPANFYNTKTIQVVDFETGSSATLFTVQGPWFAWLIPTKTGIASDNTATPAAVTL